jgi:hypothetical protein
VKQGFVLDLEGDSLNLSKIWCIAAHNLTTDKARDTTDYEDMKRLLEKADYLVMHNGMRFDGPVMERILGVKIKAKIVDTLALSWYLYPERLQHGLEGWGEDFNIPKPPIIRWDDPDKIEEYRHRCREDVKINTKLWKKMWAHLLLLYGNEEEVWRFIDYLMFKMDCAREQERSRWKLDIELCTNSLEQLEKDKEKAVQGLIEAMPSVPITVKKTRPVKPYKANGDYSVHGALWFKLLRDNDLPEDYDGEVEVVKGYVPGNPNSSQQVKAWLYSKGWKPETFKYVKEEDGTTRAIPQINQEHGAGICPSIVKLYDDSPEFSLLEGLGVISHRISILRGFLDSVDSEGFVQAQIAGLTNTLRFKHKTVVNLPKVNKPYGDIIRGCLIAPDGYELCGSDMASLEDRLKQHYLYPLDPEYVKQMMTDDFDPHLDLALLAKEVTQEQIDKYKSGEDKSIKPIRDIFKNGNYACQYGAGPPRLALTANISEKKAKAVWETYWKKNWAIKEVAAQQEVKTLKGQMWLKNPINGFFYSLRYEKDIFSTLVQGSASYVFDLWVQTFRKKRSQLTAQFHDEVVICVKQGFREQAERLLRDAIAEVNNQLKLNRELGIDVQFGSKYSDIH